MGLIKEFKEFALKGNMVDIAVGIVIGAAFSTVVQSLVKDLLTPPLGMLTEKVDFETMGLTLREANPAEDVSRVYIAYGSFLNALLSFFIMAVAIFIVIKMINRMREQFEQSNTTPTPTSKKCPHCLMEVPLDATKCGHCTSDLS